MNKETKKKVKIAFFDFADCEGCQLQLTYLNTAFLGLLDHCEIVNFREAMSERSDDYDIAFIEGSITREHDEERVKKIRENAKILIAYGACATIGGVNGMRRRYSDQEAKKIVYGDRPFHLEAGYPRAVNEVVKVDYYIHGCPTNNEETVLAIKSILLGKGYVPPTYAVCVECKMKENECMFDKGVTCMGPVTRGGCNAWCTSWGNTCYGCRGLLDDPAKEGHTEILKKYGYTMDELKQRFDLYNSCRISNEEAKKNG
ncbi:coenzyme F420-reducing hydrogenase, gamma subunit [Candidatus Omnitrophus magneticus]|uniref:Coenzyme F420-reducing hydrogenase, gamma subunit n=1 Tax=Candidatus Omnitrophus magneticus TaxID=1609969 RepID=A0A0F0CNV3_9BACT|nr:coenzyme F420-reducing hydrogenase, gamma subunit [Candidatus Omnitrophus magneticus]